MKYRVEIKERTCGTPWFHLHCSRCTNVSGVSLLVIEITNFSCLTIVPSARALQTDQVSHLLECYHHFLHLDKIEFQSHLDISNKKYLILSSFSLLSFFSLHSSSFWICVLWNSREPPSNDGVIIIFFKSIKLSNFLRHNQLVHR